VGGWVENFGRSKNFGVRKSANFGGREVGKFFIVMR
jgi:hypothetical protein